MCTSLGGERSYGICLNGGFLYLKDKDIEEDWKEKISHFVTHRNIGETCIQIKTIS